MAVTVLHAPDDVTTVGNPIAYKLESDLIDDQVWIVIQIWVEDVPASGTFRQLAELDHPVDSNSQAVFYLEDYLKAQLDYDIPNFEATTIEDCTKCYRKYYIKYGERTLTTTPTFTQAANKEVIFSAFNWVLFPSKTQTLPSDRRLMSTRPLTRVITEEQREFLYIMPLEVNDIDFGFTITYTDATTHNFTENYACTENIPFIVPVGFNAKDYNQYNIDKKISSIAISITSNVSTLQSIVLNIEEARVGFSREFYYFNKLGGMDSLIVTGVTSEGNSYSRQQSKRYIDYNYLTTDAEYVTDEITVANTYKANVGFAIDNKRAKADYFAAREILESEIVFMKVLDNFVQVMLLDTSKPKETDRNYNYAFDFNFRLAHNQTAIVPQNI